MNSLLKLSTAGSIGQGVLDLLKLPGSNMYQKYIGSPYPGVSSLLQKEIPFTSGIHLPGAETKIKALADSMATPETAGLLALPGGSIGLLARNKLLQVLPSSKTASKLKSLNEY